MRASRAFNFQRISSINLLFSHSLITCLINSVHFFSFINLCKFDLDHFSVPTNLSIGSSLRNTVRQGLYSKVAQWNSHNLLSQVLKPEPSHFPNWLFWNKINFWVIQISLILLKLSGHLQSLSNQRKRFSLVFSCHKVRPYGKSTKKASTLLKEKAHITCQKPQKPFPNDLEKFAMGYISEGLKKMPLFESVPKIITLLLWNWRHPTSLYQLFFDLPNTI